MTMSKLICATALAAFTAGGALAQNITAADPQSLMNFFADEGAPAKLDVDNVGDPLIEMKHYGTEFAVYFYGCDDGKSCDAIQFFSGYSTDGKTPIATINVWNRENRYGRAYLTDEGNARVEYDIYTGADGITREDFAEVFEMWLSVMGQFEKHIDW
ncbi:YbjN domain-containing protein [Aliiroseovarius crassostreae]|nr:YbjN domain-containing protein [Aliiroseovarius crassostreae]